MGSTAGTARTPKSGTRGVTPLVDPDTRYNAPPPQSYAVRPPGTVRNYDQPATATVTTAAPQPAATAQGAAAAAETGVVEIPLYREQLQVGKRVVPKGGVVLRKVVETDTHSEPVELRREEFVIERVSAEEAERLRENGAATAFQDREVLIELNREVPVVEKSATVREVVRAQKTIDTRNEVVSGIVRRETIDVDQSGAKASGNRPTSATETRNGTTEFAGASAGSSQGAAQGGTQAAAQREQQDGAELFLHQEQLRVGKRVVPAGQVVLRKNVTSEEVSRPIELREEDVRVERAAATGQETNTAANAFTPREIYIPLNQEIPTVQKQVELVEVVRAGKRIDTEQQTVTGQVRSERVEVAETRGTNTAAGGSAPVERGSQTADERK
jgi:uncharacterized protein (TIGR02271 family)